MSAKTKILVSVSVICLAISVAVVAIVAVFAATHHTVNSTVSVTYDVKDVIGSCHGWYKVANSADFTSMGLVNFNADDENNKQQSIPVEALTLTSANNYVEFKYEFANTSDASTGKDYKIALTYSDDKTADNNVKIAWSFGSATANYGNTEVDVVGGWSARAIGSTTTVAKGGTCVVYIRISISDNRMGASFSGDFKWTVTAA